MAREQYTERQPQDQQQEAAPAAAIAETSSPAIVTQGAIPPVAATSSAASATASQRAFGGGPGVQALEALLAKGAPNLGEVVSLIDAHRDEHDAMLGVIAQRVGDAFAASVRSEMRDVRASISRRELVAGDPGDPASGYVLVSQHQGGAKWRTAGGGFTGTADKNGLDTQVRLGEHDALHAHAGKDKTGTLAWERDGVNQGELYGRYGGSHDYEAGARRRFDVGGGTLTAGARHRVDAAGSTDGVFGTYQRGTTTAEASAGIRDGHAAGSASIATTRGADQLSASIAHDSRGTTLDAKDVHTFGGGYTGTAQIHHGPDGTTGMLAGAYKDADTQLDGNITRGIDRTSLHLGGTQQLSPQMSVTGAFDHVRPDHGASQSTLSLSERYRSGELLHGANLELGHGARDYLKASGSLDARLAPNLYGGVWAGSEVERGHQASAQLGASLTFSTNEKTALTLAGVLDQDGRLETRLQFDLFKSKIESIGDLDREKKNALVSVFLSYSQAGNRHTLDQRFGEPQVQTPIGNQVTAGIKIKF